MQRDGDPKSLTFAPRGSAGDVERGRAFTPKFDAAGLIPCVTQSDATGEVLMVAYMNADALSLTLQTGIVHYWSRSRCEIWQKGETSGQRQTVLEMRTDCDQDVVLIKVDVAGDGGCCHVGFRSCFYRTVDYDANEGQVNLSMAGNR
jgi:phosphoribosyl-AMP cyclohydrolase